jgi:hypothetical protein
MCAILLCASSAVAANGAAEIEPAGPLSLPPIRPGSADTVNLNRHALYWLDERGARSIDQVEADAEVLNWRLRRRDSQGPIHGGALWIQFEFEAPRGHPWYLEIAAPFHDKVQLFHRDRAGAWVRQEAGTALSVADWSVPGRLPTFRMVDDDPRPVRYWLRIEDDRSDFVAPVVLLREDALHTSREREQFMFGTYLGLATLVGSPRWPTDLRSVTRP